MDYKDLFKTNIDAESKLPLAELLRPKHLDDFFGQTKLLDKNSLLRNAILNDKVGNIILFGPSGVGKTTLVGIISKYTRSNVINLNAVFSGIKELRSAINEAENRLINSKRKTILFIDEVHRFTSAQQDALLPSIEKGNITFIGATTENPYYAVNKALLSRSRIFKLLPLDDYDLAQIIKKVIFYYTNIKDPKKIEITKSAKDHLIKFSNGDGRTLINALEFAIEASFNNKKSIITIDLEIAEDAIQSKKVIYDKNGHNHFDVVSAFIKSVRGSDPDASLFWLANMIRGGEDPKYIFRRLFILASEDVGLADPNAIVVVNSCSNAFDRVGYPEGTYFIAQATLYLAITLKSCSLKSIFKCINEFDDYPSFEVPDHLRNNSRNYINPHNSSKEHCKQNYMPECLNNFKLWESGNKGWEKIKFDPFNNDLQS